MANIYPTLMSEALPDKKSVDEAKDQSKIELKEIGESMYLQQKIPQRLLEKFLYFQP